MGSALVTVRKFPPEARREIGFQLRRVQSGLPASDWKPLPSIGPGVSEIRVHTGVEHRVFYVAKFAEAVYVLHAFEKRTPRTAQADLELGRRRFAQMLRWRARKES